MTFGWSLTALTNWQGLSYASVWNKTKIML